MTAPTQITQARHPWRAVLRTIVAYIPPVAIMLPEAAKAAGVERWAWVATILAVAGGITRVLAVPSVNAFFQQVFPPLAAAPKTPRE
ncbi:hypothetical protein [Micromonospora aurantiaca (nom. illeg.)]|uniref:Uncharacterized protein n=1 Tax=Micromonospora aurantiaca (nom. illeg.) TaxID=47850 RepID=A0ABQ6UFM7_9ACTN|nr:hypothetical protein [Micromonospora aurantiaca]KAB1111975.1 hypothetical protein F6X54_15995 [Micromonospora aurantiaca]